MPACKDWCLHCTNICSGARSVERLLIGMGLHIPKLNNKKKKVKL